MEIPNIPLVPRCDLVVDFLAANTQPSPILPLPPCISCDHCGCHRAPILISPLPAEKTTAIQAELVDLRAEASSLREKLLLRIEERKVEILVQQKRTKHHLFAANRATLQAELWRLLDESERLHRLL